MRRTYDDLKQRSRQRVIEKLQDVIGAYDGTARNVREILRGSGGCNRSARAPSTSTSRRLSEI
jgi:hypothetical protein